HVANEAVNEEMDDSLERAAITATSLYIKQDRGNIFKTQSKATPNEPGYQGTSSGGGPRCQEIIGDTIAQTRSERVSKISNDLLLTRFNTPRSGKDSMKLNELMELYTKLQQRVLDLETTKTTQALEINKKSSKDKGLGEEDTSKQGNIANIDANEDIYLVNVHNDEDMFDADQDLGGEEVNDEAVTFNLNQTTRYSSTYDDLSVNQIDIIDVAKEDDFILEEIEAYLKDESISPEIDHVDCDSEGDIFLNEKLLNNNPFQLPPMDLKQGEVVKAKSLIEKPPELELKDLPSHLEYAYLEGKDKLPVIIAKDLKIDEKEALLKVLKSHKREIAWKIIDIKGIDPRFCTHKILMEEDYKTAVQS
nr:reverse transcriptase domain-containing protein [Tanacetum cinerariifolium]